MDTSRHLRRWELAALLTLCLCLTAGLWAQGRQRTLSAGLVRLHVLAHSNAPEEQALKLRVRDAVLDYLAPLLADTRSADDAQTLLARELDGIRTAAAAAAEGRPVTVTLGEERYPTRDYAGFSLPAGRYRSLRISLGAGQGHNWWCVVFPPLCLAAAQRETLRPAMNPADYALITRAEGWELRFRLVELWGELVGRLEE